ncbi:MAG: hypothetical protein EBS90_10605 [Betaproteobacteria bacterium]|nr:hypothetical protein [Betaproteobacteria bacterium]
MIDSESKEKAWRLAAAMLRDAIVDRRQEISDYEQALAGGGQRWDVDWPEAALLQHIEDTVIPSLNQRALIIQRNRRRRWG